MTNILVGFAPHKISKDTLIDARKKRKLRVIAKANPDLVGEVI